MLCIHSHVIGHVSHPQSCALISLHVTACYVATAWSESVHWIQFTDGSFHIAFDKGGLDALMGEDTEAAGTSGSKLLSEVQRVLDPSDGQYFCVTLGQTHVLRKFLLCLFAVSVCSMAWTQLTTHGG